MIRGEPRLLGRWKRLEPSQDDWSDTTIGAEPRQLVALATTGAESRRLESHNGWARIRVSWARSKRFEHRRDDWGN